MGSISVRVSERLRRLRCVFFALRQVDTFHSFHWGDHSERGWRAHPGIVEDTRLVFAQSAARQGIEWK
jgi:hypothetical protein